MGIIIALVSAVFIAHGNLKEQKVATGFGFLVKEAGFEISETPINYQAEDSYLKALGVGVLNTLKVALIGNLLAILLGVIMGIARLSSHWMVNKIAHTYIEVTRNIPLLLQLFFWYALFTEVMPSIRHAHELLPGVFICNRGLFFPVPDFSSPFPWLSFPILEGFNFSGGMSLSPEFAALLLGLVLYTGAFNAEIVRTGILAIGKGQWDAAKALGLGSWSSLRYVILPQAIRVILPPLNSQLLNLTKNSSLAVAIGYPDFVSVANTALNQTGQAIELVTLIMLVYLAISLSTSFVVNRLNQKMAIVER